MTKDERVSDALLKQYLRPWYAPMSVTIYRDIKAMAAELLKRRGGYDDAAVARMMEEARKNPVTPAEAKEMRDV